MRKYIRKFREPAEVAVMEVDLGLPPLTRARAAAAASGRRRRAAAGARKADAQAEKSPFCRKPARAKAAIAAKVGDGLEAQTAFNSTGKCGSELAQIMEMEALGTTAKPSVGLMRHPEAEIEGFFAAAEMLERKRFTDKYNYDVEKDVPMEGRYEWVRLVPSCKGEKR